MLCQVPQRLKGFASKEKFCAKIWQKCSAKITEVDNLMKQLFNPCLLEMRSL